MNKFALLLAAMLPFASSSASAEAERSADLRYCLDLKSNEEIAECAGEIAAGEKGKPFPREKVKKILSTEEAGIPVGAASGTPPSANEKPGQHMSPEKTEIKSN